MKKKLLFIYNPHAGKGKIKSRLSEIIEIFNENYYEVVVYSTKCKKDAKQIVIECLQHEDYEYVICSGGDGTLNEVVNGLMNCDMRPKLGYLPAGTTNDYAYSLKVSNDIRKAAKEVLEQGLLSCDVGSFNDNYFVYNAAFGLFTEASYQTPQATKNKLGRFAYIIEGIKKLHNVKSYFVEITMEGKIIRDEFIFGMISNSNSVGGFKGITGKNVSLNDGQFEGIFIKKPQNLLELQNIIVNLSKGNLKHEKIISFPVKELKITSKELVPWAIDGEFGGELQRVAIKNCSQVITIASILGNEHYFEDLT